jgi:2-polyprenyl-6-hydroxyphenyl methylase/3-demethylubiquinone-9 3-methyltransferase
VITTRVTRPEEIRGFFDREAAFMEECHGQLNPLLTYRTGLIRRYLPPVPQITMLDIGCGTGHHLLALAPYIETGIGIDFSRAMIEAAGKRADASRWQEKITFLIDDAEELGTIADSSVDFVTCIGALEHMVNKSRVIANVHRVLKPSGTFLCLTPNGSYLWYSLAASLRVPVKHLSTDVFLTAQSIRRYLLRARFEKIETGYWSFVPKGDLHRAIGFVLKYMDIPGKTFGIDRLRGGVMTAARKPAD